MTKRTSILTLLLALCMLLLLSGCFGSNTRLLQRHIDPSQRFTEAEIQAAMDLAVAQFKKGFDGCTLLTMEYDESAQGKAAAGWAEDYGADEAIILTSTFTTNGDVACFNPWDIYTGWQWILTRDDGGRWELRTWGYG